MGAGGQVQQHAAIKTAVNDPSILLVLPQACQDRVAAINSKGLADWTEDETSFMAAMPTVAVHT
jgi:hypothetical protein